MQVPVSKEVDEIIEDATTISVQRGHFFVGVKHLFEALLANPALLPPEIVSKHLEALNATHGALMAEGYGGAPVSSEVFYTPRTAMLVKVAARVAKRLGNGQPRAGHLLLAILLDSCAGPSRAMDRIGLPRRHLADILGEMLHRMGHPGKTASAPQ